MLKDNKKDIATRGRLIDRESSTYFGKSAPLYFVFKKAERLVSALYLVTDLFPIDDPLRTGLRQEGLHVLSLIAHWRGGDTSSERVCTEIQESVSDIIGKLNVAAMAGILSAMNQSVLEREYNLLLDFLLSEHNGQDLKGSTIDSGFFDIEENVLYGDKGHDSVKSGRMAGSLQKDIKMSHSRDVSESAVAGQRHTDRRSVILELVAQKGRISVKDVADKITTCSEKTLQRELLALVEEGVLKKEGERRWSTYVLAG